MTEADFKRLNFRVDWLIENFKKRQLVLKNGNLATWEPELSATNLLGEDLADVLKELMMLLKDRFQKEQGLISPPNEEATSSETPTG